MQFLWCTQFPEPLACKWSCPLAIFKGSSFTTQGLNGINKCTWTRSTDTETFTCRRVVYLGSSTWLWRGQEDLPLLRELDEKVYIIVLVSKKLLKKASVCHSLHFPASFLLSVLHLCTYYSYTPHQRFCFEMELPRENRKSFIMRQGNKKLFLWI